jgi:hypothetical protein
MRWEGMQHEWGEKKYMYVISGKAGTKETTRKTKTEMGE